MAVLTVVSNLTAIIVDSLFSKHMRNRYNDPISQSEAYNADLGCCFYRSKVSFLMFLLFYA